MKKMFTDQIPIQFILFVRKSKKLQLYDYTYVIPIIQIYLYLLNVFAEKLPPVWIYN